MFYRLILVGWLATCLWACSVEQSSFDQKAAEEEILELHHAQRDYHFQKDSVGIAQQIGPGYMSVNRGEISQPSMADNLEQFNHYFSAVDFVKWDDVTPPVIRFSEDGTMAYTVVDKEVIVEYKVSETETVLDSTYFAWVAIYKKQAAGWQLDCIASTNR